MENQKDETEIIRAIPSLEIEATERKLLVQAKDFLPRIPIDPVDLLIIDQMGKDISGAGMDQNVIARTVMRHHQVPSKPKIARIFVRSLLGAETSRMRLSAASPLWKTNCRVEYGQETNCHN